MIVDLFLVFQFIKRLSTPFKDWDAYKLGIIDEKGTQLIKRKDFTKRDQKDAFGIFDIMIMKLKRLLEKIPGGKSRIGSYAAALYLIKEQESINASGIDLIESYSEDELEETLTKYIESVQIEESNMDIDQLFEDMFDGKVAESIEGIVKELLEKTIIHEVTQLREECSKLKIEVETMKKIMLENNDSF